MEKIVITPKDAEELEFFKIIFQKIKTNVSYFKREKETSLLDKKIARLYIDDYYSIDELQYFLTIPSKYRVDPFILSPSGDLYYADKRNLEKLHHGLEKGKKDFENGNTIELKKGKSIWEIV